MNRNGFPLLNPCLDRHEFAERVGVSVFDILCDLSFQPLRDLILAGGSIVEGLGNKESDIDIFVIHGKQAYRDESKKVRLASRTRRWIDIIHMSVESVQSVHQQIYKKSATLPAEWGQFSGIPLDALDLYHRLCLAVQLNDPILESDFMPTFERAVLGKALCLTFLIPARARWVDAVGAFESGQFGQARYVTRFCLEYALTSYCALLGETNPSEKWLAAKLARLKNDPISAFELFVHCSYELQKDEERAIVTKLLKNVANILYQITHRLVYGEFANIPPTNESILERYEVTTDGRNIIVNALGEFSVHSM
ncbi:nucleotidyltransferase domain-containing protein [Nostoc sp. FACHB-145]|uniref:nucleotidyltransferase domain-containing protein n=1 Tax=Nostoc sp. FACHB-145 TaxID=2692836 RepID=UPI001682E2FE|nr:nucleotidyltransferase domain-containing protein [Nostoc sp. FACHB-145]MBD2470946.1 nucleotidyltransferase domain-containing protein [Nostoc sp. FACHB-145]